MIPRHHWRHGEIWSGNLSFLSHHICTVQWSSHLICWRLMSCSHQDLGELFLQLAGLGWGRSFWRFGHCKFKQLDWVPTDHAHPGATQSASVELAPVLTCLQHFLKPLFIPVDSLVSLHSEFKHYIHSLKLNCEKPFPSLWTTPHHVKNVFS